MYRIRQILLVLALTAVADPAVSHADIFRWDNGQVIPGTEGITLGPGVQLNGQELVLAQLSETDLSGANFAGANLDGAKLELSRLADANFAGANVRGASIFGTSGGGLTKEQLYSTASYQTKDLRGMVFGSQMFHWAFGGDLSGWDFSGQDLTSASFRFSQLTGANLRGANLTGAVFAPSMLTHADLTGAALHGSNFTGANLSGANLQGADMAHSFVIDANLTGAAMDGSNLTSANVMRTDMRGARGLNLTGAITSNVIQPNGRINALGLAPGERLVANAGVEIPVRFGPDFSMDPTATLDITDNAAIVDYSSFPPIDQVREHLRTARGGAGKWNGTGITSSTARLLAYTQSDASSLGYADNAAMPLGRYTTFHGASVDDTSILIAYTRTGDANLDGVVNDDDVTIVGAHYSRGVPNAQWALGDFDYNGYVNDDDVTLLGAFYDPSAQPLVKPGPPGGSTMSAIPEPSTAAMLLAATLIAYLGRRLRFDFRMWPKGLQ